ncbi:unnamed protein product [Pleuronectes platessa]|uniref:Uncharacterized protein n=1 Tax=Pleuronectes platessa TaxID=8262 RepID=A0A9N7Z145_PLEPL|nr:unnamed protein product [Pleuronectes platessa]
MELCNSRHDPKPLKQLRHRPNEPRSFQKQGHMSEKEKCSWKNNELGQKGRFRIKPLNLEPCLRNQPDAGDRNPKSPLDVSLSSKLKRHLLEKMSLALLVQGLFRTFVGRSKFRLKKPLELNASTCFLPPSVRLALSTRLPGEAWPPTLLAEPGPFASLARSQTLQAGM